MQSVVNYISRGVMLQYMSKHMTRGICCKTAQVLRATPHQVARAIKPKTNNLTLKQYDNHQLIYPIVISGFLGFIARDYYKG